ncbi:MAG: Rho termination factor N-terminal domain-containing protein [Deltaproteobacteria bacterium]|nr:Rho termination factor N-terminal domain-containing protein [Deltaproteobacteria bacterium]
MAEKGKPVDKMTVKELREVAKELGAQGVSGMKKDELLAFIRKAKGLREKQPKRVAKKKAKKRVWNIKELKEKITSIKAKRAEALQKGDKRMATIYKRQINRLKKRTRKAAQPAVGSEG